MNREFKRPITDFAQCFTTHLYKYDGELRTVLIRYNSTLDYQLYTEGQEGYELSGKGFNTRHIIEAITKHMESNEII